MNTSKAKKIIIVLGITDMILFSIYGYFMYDMIEKGRAVSVLYDELNIQTKQRSLGTVAQAFGANNDIVNAHFVGISDIVPFMENIESLGKKAGVSLSIISIANGASSLDITLRVSGPFKNIYQTLALLESTPYKIRIKNFNMARSDSAWDSSISLSLLSFINK